MTRRVEDDDDDNDDDGKLCWPREQTTVAVLDVDSLLFDVAVAVVAVAFAVVVGVVGVVVIDISVA